MRAMAFVIRFARSSKLPAHPTQKSTSGAVPAAVISAMVGMCIELILI
jgi:hypothetical protein